MIRHWTIRRKLTIGIAFALLVSIALTLLVNLLLTRSVFIDRLNQSELPTMLSKISKELELEIQGPVTVSQFIASNPYLDEWMAKGESKEGLAAWKQYAVNIQQKSGADVVFLVSGLTRNYYASEGLRRHLDPEKDQWFDGFMNSGQGMELALDVDKTDHDLTLFINVRTANQKAIAGLGLKIKGLAKRIGEYRIGKQGFVYLVDAAGQIKIHPDSTKVQKPIRDIGGMAPLVDALLVKDQETHFAEFSNATSGRVAVAAQYIPALKWYVVSEIPMSDLYSDLNLVTLQAIAIGTFLGLLFIGGGIVFATRITDPLQRMTVATKEVAAGNLDIQLDVEREDELGELARSFNSMTQSVKYHQANLERLVDERTAQLREKTQDIQAMLQNMPQGILTIVGGGVVHPEYSTYLETIFETKEIAGRSAMELLFSHSRVGSDARDSVGACLGACVGEDQMNFEFNAHVLVRDADLVFADGRTKYLEYIWSPICDEAGIIEKLMVCVRDVTELRRLAAEADKGKRELEMIGQILRVKQEKFHEFIDSARAFISENRGLISAAAANDGTMVASLFRNMHTIKGNARTYGLLHVTNIVHEAEQAYDELRKNPEATYDQAALLAQLAEVESSLEEYAQLNEVTLGRKGPGRRGSVERYVMVERSHVDGMLSDLSAIDLGARRVDELAAAISKMRSALQVIGTERLPDVLDGVVASLPSLAGELGKEAPQVRINDHGVVIKNQVSDLLRNVFMHLYRNSMDHGIEKAAERLAAGKPAQGSIVLEAALDSAQLSLRLSDDGRGLALGAIRRRAAERGLLPADGKLSDEEVAQLIFAAGFSTAETVTEVSGRGVGMDAVQDFIRREGGQIRLAFTDNKTGADFRAFETVVSLPAPLALATS